MASYDIVSFFTNIPVDETIEIIINKAFSHQNITVTQRTRTFLMQVETKNKIFRRRGQKPKYEYVTRQITEGVELFQGLRRHQLKELLVIYTKKSHFQFKGSYLTVWLWAAHQAHYSRTFLWIGLKRNIWKKLRNSYHGSDLWIKFFFY